MHSAQDFLQYAPEVAAARAAGRPVVALESTIVAHGMPWPQNFETAHAVEAEIRAAGAVPATIAVLDRRICVGLDAARLERLARAPDALKLSRRDLPVALTRDVVGATTVAATMICAQLAGIEVFVTGGIGGVHRGAAESFDISADLQELARTRVAVVCAGAKSILDIGLTLEYLETHGVPVLSCGQDEFAAFYCRDSGFKADLRLDAAAEQARFIRAKWALGLAGGVLLSVPVPEGEGLPRAEVDAWIAAALADAAARGVHGKAVTPFLLARIKELSDGRSLSANIALVKNNARAGAALAVALQAQR
ncbi:MAG: pseudouridine-5'-phosphate glycosidase [Pelomonas sp.]|nr:pseudouridine-5'-phosphate glycosidase [Roseateles sp.]